MKNVLTVYKWSLFIQYLLSHSYTMNIHNKMIALKGTFYKYILYEYITYLQIFQLYQWDVYFDHSSLQK